MQLHAPATWETSVTDAYAPLDLFIHGARSIVAGFRDDANALVAGLVKIQWGDNGANIEVPVPAGNMVPLPPVDVGCLPSPVRLDGRVLATSAGGDTLVLMLL